MFSSLPPPLLFRQEPSGNFWPGSPELPRPSAAGPRRPTLPESSPSLKTRGKPRTPDIARRDDSADT